MVKIYCAARCGNSGSETVYALLGYAMRDVFGIGLPLIEKTSNGKPFFPERPDIHFSLSHAKTHVLCVLSDSPVGADIESPRYISPRACKFFLSPEESAMFNPLDLWVLKESYIKLIGATLPSVGKIRFSREGEKIITPDISVTSKLYHVEGCTAAISASGDNIYGSIELITRSLIYPR